MLQLSTQSHRCNWFLSRFLFKNQKGTFSKLIFTWDIYKSWFLRRVRKTDWRNQKGGIYAESRNTERQQRKVLCIQVLKSCSTPWWQTNKQTPCLFFSAQWLQQTHSASFRLARQLALLTKTNSMLFFPFFFLFLFCLFFVGWFNYKDLPHSHLFPYHQ